MPKWQDTEKGKDFLKQAFETAGLPEVDESLLEPGTYTNRQIAEKFNDPRKLLAILMLLPGSDPASKRSVLRFVVDGLN
jgi:hypothetical protein